VLAESFVLPPLSAPDTPDAPFHQVRGRKLFQTHTRYTDHLDHALRNEGTVNCYDRLHLPIAAIAQADDKGVRDARYRAEAWIDGAAGVATMTSFTPNRVLIDVDAAGGGTLVVNQNFDAAWKARVSGQDAPILTHQGVLGVALPSDGQRAQVELSYVPSRLGALFTLCTGLFAIGWLVAAGRRRK
jgi:hypothetical protein